MANRSRQAGLSPSESAMLVAASDGPKFAVNGWPVLSLREAGVSLIDCEHRTPPAADFGYPYIAIPQVKNGHLDLADCRKISREHFSDWTRKALPQQDDVVLSRRCNPGETAWVPDGLECALGQNLVLLRSNGRHIFPPFLRWLVRGPEWWSQIQKFLNVGAIFDSLKCADVPNFQLSVPPLEVQQRIAHILGTLDDKIELNRRTNQTLEAMAKAIFKSWFVDFDPVKSKAAGQRPLGLDPATAALFPGAFEESAIGRVPSGWAVRWLREIADLASGGTPKKQIAAYWNGNVPWVSPKAMNDIHVSDSEDHVSEAAIGNGTRRVPKGTTLVMVRGMGLHQGVRISQAQRDVAFNQDVKAIIATSVPADFLFFALLNAGPGLLTKVHAAGHGTGVLATDHLDRLAFAVPGSEGIQLLSQPLISLNAKIAAVTEESKLLSAIRDLLLPKLLSGEIGVPEAYDAVEEVVG